MFPFFNFIPFIDKNYQMARKLKDQQIDTIFKAANSSRQYIVNFLAKRQFVEMDQRRAKHIKRMDK
jgi:hypothetical protein